MATPTIHDTLVDASGSPLIGATVEISLVVGADLIANGFVTSIDESVSAPIVISTDGSGFWSTGIIPNPLVTPANTAYRVRYKRAQHATWDDVFYVSVPNTSLNYWVGDILTGAPGGPGPSVDLSAYQLRSEKDVASGYAGLDGNSHVGLAKLGTGTPDSTKFLRGDQSWQVPPGTSSPSPTQYENMDKRSVSGAVTLDASSFNVFDLTLTGNITSLTIANTDVAHAWSMTLILRQDATGGRTISWGTAFKWSNGIGASLSTAAGKIDVFTVVSTDNGVTWFAFQAGQGMA